MKLREKLTAWFASEKELFSQEEDWLIRNNLKALRVSSMTTMGIVIAFIIFALLFLPNWQLSPHYLFFFAWSVLFVLLVYVEIPLQKMTFRKSKIFCMLFLSMLMTFLLVIDIYPDRAMPAIFVPLFLAVSPVIFVLPFKMIISYMLLTVIVFCGADYFAGGRITIYSDVFQLFAGLIFGMFIYLTMMDVRKSEMRMKARLKLLSSLDSLTGILNRGSCEAFIEAYLQARIPGDVCAMLIFDLDDFKYVNDTFGHMEGDFVLESFGNILQRAFRKTDTFSRFGGDEFVVFMRGIKGTEFLVRKCDYVQKELSMVLRHRNHEIHCSIGAAVTQKDRVTFEELYKEADAALYEAKRKGKSRFILHYLGKEDN